MEFSAGGALPGADSLLAFAVAVFAAGASTTGYVTSSSGF